MERTRARINRRNFFTHATKASAAIAAGSLVTWADVEEVSARVNTFSEPSELKITDMRIAHLRTPSGYGERMVVRIDTNQGISGYSDIETGETYALMLKQRILGENPLNLARIKQKIMQWGYHARQGGGVSAVDMAVLDIAGKAWGVPAWQILGGKFRDKVMLYADTTFSTDPVEMGDTLKERIGRGYKYLKMDLNFAHILRDIPDTMIGTGELGPELYSQWNFEDDRRFNMIPHPFTGIGISDKGVQLIREYCEALRAEVGYETPIATDHYGHFPVETMIQVGREIDRYNFAWFEDMVPFEYVDQYKKLREQLTTPILTGEDIFGREGFRDLIEQNAVAIIHPDIARAGGAWEIVKISELATMHGVQTAFHMSGFPFRMMAAVHSAAACENFLCCEFHDVDNPDYTMLATGLPDPLVDDGYVRVPDGPGLGIEADEDAMREFLVRGEFFAPTPEWDEERTMDRIFGAGPSRHRVG